MGLLLKDLKWEPHPFTGAMEVWNVTYLTSAAGHPLHVYHAHTRSIGWDEDGVTGMFVISHEEPEQRKTWGEYPRYLDALAAQCILWALTSEGNDAP